MTAKSYQRKRKLIEPALQLKMVGIFVGLAACSIVLQMLLISLDLKRLATTMPAGNELEAEIPGILSRMLLFSAGMWLPVTVAAGIVVTHRIAGPVYRFKQHLGSVARGEAVGKCRLREKDELHGLCDAINKGLEVAFASVPPVDAEGDLPESPTEFKGAEGSGQKAA